MFADGAQERVEKESASMCVVGVFLRGHRDHDAMEDKMLLKEVPSTPAGLLRMRNGQ